MTEPRKTPRTDAAWLEHISTVSRDTVGFREHARALEIETQELVEALEAMCTPYVIALTDDGYAAIQSANATLTRHRAKQEVGT